MFWPIVNPELGASENMVLTWPLDFCLPAYFCLKKSIFAPKLIFLINFITVLWFIWDLVLVLFESQKDVVSGKILVFGNILGFPRVIGPKNGPKPSTLGTSKTTSGRNFSKLVPYLVGGGGGGKWLRNETPPPKKRWFCGYCIATKTFEHYHLAATNAYLMKLTTSMYLHKTLNFAEDWGVTHGA